MKYNVDKIRCGCIAVNVCKMSHIHQCIILNTIIEKITRVMILVFYNYTLYYTYNGTNL